jgi:hypothetical protein
MRRSARSGFIAVLAFGVGLGGCSSPGSVGTEQVGGRCPQVAQVLTGAGLYNEPCTTYLDCAPGCCPCEIGSSIETYLAAECLQGACADMTTACTDAADSTVCP